MKFIRLTDRDSGAKTMVQMNRVDCITEHKDYCYICFIDGGGLEVIESGQTIRNRIKSLGGEIV